MMMPVYLLALLCLLIIIRLMLFCRDGGTHRPYAALLAWGLTVAVAGVAILTLAGRPDLAIWPLCLVLLILLLALLAQGGNVVELFRSSGPRQSWFTLLLRRETWF